MDKEKVLKLAQLARVEIGDSEAQTLSSEFGAILDYVGEVKKFVETAKVSPSQMALNKDILKNVMREDTNSHESGIYTKAILDVAPQKNSEFIKVKKIL